MTPREDDPHRQSTASAVRAVHRAMCAAMVSADTVALGALLSDDYTLTHMTGYVQPKAEWLEQIDSGEMTYHRMEDVRLNVDLDQDLPVLAARTRTDATIWGGRGSWRLTLRSAFEQSGNEWIVTRTVASTW